MQVREAAPLHTFPSAATWCGIPACRNRQREQEPINETVGVVQWPCAIKVSALVIFGCMNAIPAVVGGILSCDAFSGLKELDLEGCITLCDEDVITACARLPNLEKIDLKGAEKLTDRALIHIAWTCTRLEMLQIGGCRGFTDGGIEGFARLIGSRKNARCVFLSL